MKQLQDITLSDSIVVADPCYSRGTWCMEFFNGVKPGVYNTFVQYGEEDRVKALIVVHEAYKPTNFKYYNSNIGVDSGQAGVFCDTIYPHGEDTGEYDGKGGFYDKCCEATLGESYEKRNLHWRISQEIERYEKDINGKELFIDRLGWSYDYHMEEYKKYKDDLLFNQYLNDILRTTSERHPSLGTWQDYAKEQESKRQWLIDYYKQHKDLYEYYFDTGRLPEPPEHLQAGTVDGKGVVSRTGWGDGSYGCYLKRNSKKEIVGVKIRYM